MAISVDIGTCFLVSAKQDDNAQIQIKSIRDAFLDMENDTSVKNMLKMSKVDFIEDDEKLYIIGDAALVMANMFKREVRRPLSRGVISPGELEAERILLVLLENIMGKAPHQGETCFYSVPGNPIDRDMDVIYHQAMFSKLIGQLGYKPVALNEAAAISYSNAAKENFSSLSISCLSPGQKIITRKGFKNIEKIEEGDEILTKEGKWEKCSPTSRPYKGTLYKIASYGQGSVEVTEDHRIWVMRDGKWQWVVAKDLSCGDFVKQPWVNFNFSKRPYICYDERVTCSEPKKVTMYLSTTLAELIGFFLGDGGIEVETGTGVPIGIHFSLDKKYPQIMDRVHNLISEVFDKDASFYAHSGNGMRLKFYSKAFAKWVKENCYDEKGDKVLPWDIADLSDNFLRYILKGLLQSDGTHTEKSIVDFGNTSPGLAQTVYLICLRLGMNPSLSVRDPREGGRVDDRVITGTKEEFSVKSGNIGAQDFVSWMKNPISSSKKACNHGAAVGVITEISTRDYDGMVYDVSVEGEDHSFCVPGIAVHNCGAGMTNVCLMYQTMIGMAFSISRGGDWIDQSAATAVGSTGSRLQSVKERGIDLMNPLSGEAKTLREREALTIYYKSLILYAFDSIRKEFEKRRGTIDLPHSIPIILSGGTSKAENFLEFFKSAFDTVKDKFSIPVSEVRLASDPLNAVAQGLLVAAMNYDEDER